MADNLTALFITLPYCSAVFSGGAGGARAPPEFGASEKGRSLISAYRSLALTTNTPGFKSYIRRCLGTISLGQAVPLYFNRYLVSLKLSKFENVLC